MYEPCLCGALDCRACRGSAAQADDDDDATADLIADLRGWVDDAELARTLEIDQIESHLYTAGEPDPDLIIRTSGEQRLSGFLMWQSAHSEFYFCEALWPDFRRVDFLRALRTYTQRERRFGR